LKSCRFVCCRNRDRNRSPSPHSIKSSQLKNKITDTSLFAELVKDRHKRELELKKLENFLEHKNDKAEAENEAKKAAEMTMTASSTATDQVDSSRQEQLERPRADGHRRHTDTVGPEPDHAERHCAAGRGTPPQRQTGTTADTAASKQSAPEGERGRSQGGATSTTHRTAKEEFERSGQEAEDHQAADATGDQPERAGDDRVAAEQVADSAAASDRQAEDAAQEGDHESAHAAR
jgi:hypothetical protein